MIFRIGIRLTIARDLVRESGPFAFADGFLKVLLRFLSLLHNASEDASI